MLERTGCVLSRNPINPITLVITAFTAATEAAQCLISHSLQNYHLSWPHLFLSPLGMQKGKQIHKLSPPRVPQRAAGRLPHPSQEQSILSIFYFANN